MEGRKRKTLRINIVESRRILAARAIESSRPAMVTRQKLSVVPLSKAGDGLGQELLIISKSGELLRNNGCRLISWNNPGSTVPSSEKEGTMAALQKDTGAWSQGDFSRLTEIQQMMLRKANPTAHQMSFTTDLARATRVAQLKERFAATIMRAQSTLNGTGDKKVALPMGQKPGVVFALASEKQGILRQRKVVERGCRLKRKREDPRVAARVAIEKMTKTADISQNMEVHGQLTTMLGSRSWVMDALNGVRRENPLTRFGLFLKEDDCMESEDKVDKLFSSEYEPEEGEILD